MYSASDMAGSAVTLFNVYLRVRCQRVKSLRSRPALLQGVHARHCSQTVVFLVEG